MEAWWHRLASFTLVVPYQFEPTVIITDKIPINKRRQATEKIIKQRIAGIAPQRLPYSIYHHDSKSSLGLQVVDYCNWAIYRKWEIGDCRSYDIIKPAIKSEFDLFQSGTTNFY
jgi:hypothetical protein